MFYKKFFSTPLFSTCFWIRDPRSGMGKNQDPGSGINIPDPQHCHQGSEMTETGPVVLLVGKGPNWNFLLVYPPSPPRHIHDRINPQVTGLSLKVLVFKNSVEIITLGHL